MTNLSTEFFPPESGPLACLTKSVAVLRLKPEELSERIGIPFQAGHDDLDILDWARVIGLSGRPYALVRHRHSPEPGTQIVVPYDSGDLWADVLDVLSGLNLSERDLAWTSQEAVPGRQAKSTRAVRPVSAQRSAGKLLLKVPPKLTKRLRKVQGRGRFHTLLRKFEKRVKGSKLELTPHDVEKLLGYSADLGTSPSKSYASPRKSTKKASRKK
jgi:hypothetical protein